MKPEIMLMDMIWIAAEAMLMILIHIQEWEALKALVTTPHLQEQHKEKTIKKDTSDKYVEL